MGRDAAGEEDLQRRIENAKQELEHMIDLHPQGMFLVDGDGVVMRANTGLLSLLGLRDFSDVLGRAADELFGFAGSSPEPRLKARLHELDRSSLASLSWNAQAVLADGRTAPLRFTAVSSRGQPTRYVVLVDDQTAEQAAARRREKEHKTQAAEAIVGTLLHVLNQPLAVIMGRAQLLLFAVEKGSAKPDEVRSSLEEIVNLSRRIADTLARARRFKDFVTEDYLAGVDILNLERSTGNEEDDDAEDTGADQA